MSRIKDMVYDIQEMYIDGMSARTIARTLEISVDQVLSVLETFGVADNLQEEYDPYITVSYTHLTLPTNREV